MDFVLELKNLCLAYQDKAVLKNISFSLKRGQHLAISGPTGSGKTSLGLALAHKLFYTGSIFFDVSLIKKICYLPQQHHFKTKNNTINFYYQQRYNSSDAETTVTVKEYIDLLDPALETFIQVLPIAEIADKPLIQLSNGENKKIQLAKAWMQKPEVLILDNPFLGLDIKSRNQLNLLLESFAANGGLIILITSDYEMPSFINRVITLVGGRIKSDLNLLDFKKSKPQVSQTEERIINKNLIDISSPSISKVAIISMRNLSVSYGNNLVLDHIHWEVFSGERWLITGPNGAGKSTLLALITGDHPQAYANEIYLFGRKRGSGESIWDIKNRIGFLSSELHLYFDMQASCFETVASGIYHTIGLFKKPNQADRSKVEKWMDITGIGSYADQCLGELSLGNQRMVLLTRALVRSPELLVLDEACQGLDQNSQSIIFNLIDHICLSQGTTLIYVTHYPHDIPKCINKQFCLENGSVVLKKS